MNEPLINQPTMTQAVEQFLYHEANLIDDQDFEAWIELFTKDALYWVPANEAQMDPTQHVSIVYDTREDIKDRLWRLGSGIAHAQEPASKTIHQISNVIVNSDSQNDDVSVRCHLVIYEYRHNHHLRSMDVVAQYPARCEYQLRPTGGSYQIALRKINLLAANGALGNMGFII